MSRDNAAEWVSLAESFAEIQNIKQAISCYDRGLAMSALIHCCLRSNIQSKLLAAIKQDKSDANLYWKRSKLHEKEGDEKAMYDDYQKMLPLLANTDPVRHMHISAELTRVSKLF